MDRIYAGLVRHLFEGHIGPALWQKPGAVVELFDLEPEELLTLQRFAGDVGAHILERLAEPPPYSREWLAKYPSGDPKPPAGGSEGR